MAYACPMQRCTDRAAGGISHRLYPGGATVCRWSSADRIDKGAPPCVARNLVPAPGVRSKWSLPGAGWPFG
ncbi:hypothetical protein Pa4123_21180 [Phytohabitans aurantiacus]|uniref:Uncharacterized protein n=1 Tax=Phytohabitans aurantiacus TaxID=3016789 RepID=A0ABQ5QRI2_9ACTN|nr:hypothetical protein Pa4123_21180 [Phytohabitans aurantiacus]